MEIRKNPRNRPKSDPRIHPIKTHARSVGIKISQARPERPTSRTTLPRAVIAVKLTTMLPRRFVLNARPFAIAQATRSMASTPRVMAAPPDAPSLVKSFLYGSEKGQELQREMEQSYSKVLARGKYVHKMNQHFVKPDKIDEYIALMSVHPRRLLTVERRFSQKSPTIPRMKSTW